MARTLALPVGEGAVLEALRVDAHLLDGDAADYDALLDLVGDAPLVLLGEASHGTHEFYRERGRITRRLIEERGFAAVAIEGATGPMPTASTATCRAPTRMATPSRPSAASSDSPLGCGATPRCWT